jgi:isoamylase
LPKAAPGGPISSTLLLLNAYSEDREFTLPEPAQDWEILVDAAEAIEVDESEVESDTDADADAEHAADNAASAPPTKHVRAIVDNRISVAAHSAVLLGIRNIAV